MKLTTSTIFWTMALIVWSCPSFAITSTLTNVTPAQLITNSTQITFEFVSDAPDADFMCSLDYQEYVRCSSPWSYKNLSDGRHHFRVYANSPTEGLDTIGSSHQWLIDTAPPRTTLNVNPMGQDDYVAQLISSEPNSSFVCSLDGVTLFACSSPHMLTAIPAGHHVFKSFAIDEAGNVDPVGADFAFTIVSRIPLTTTITNVNPNNPYTNITRITFDFVASQPSATFQCSLAGTTTPCTNPHSYLNLTDGNYVFKVQAIDVLGNIDPVGAQYSWTVDTTPPVGTITRLDSTSTIVTVSWTTNEPASSELNWGLGVDLSKSAPGNSTLTTNHTIQIMGLSSNTPYSFRPWGVDRAGNRFEMSGYSVRTKR